MIYDKNQIFWNYVLFKNKVVSRTDRLNVIIKDAPQNKKDVTIRTVDKLIVDKNYVKIIGIGN